MNAKKTPGARVLKRLVLMLAHRVAHRLGLNEGCSVVERDADGELFACFECAGCGERTPPYYLCFGGKKTKQENDKLSGRGEEAK